MWAAIVVAIQALVKELVCRIWERANERTLAKDAPAGPGNVYDRFSKRVQQYTGRVRPPGRP